AAPFQAPPLSLMRLPLLAASLVVVMSSAADTDGARARRKAPAPEEPVIVVGGGLAGLSATLEAVKHGATKVILIDSEKSLGGNSAKASSGINACNTPTQAKMGIEDSTDRFRADTMSAGDRENDEGLVEVLVEESAAAIEFLEEAGVDLGDINLCGGHSVPRTHWIPSPKEGKPLPVGFGIISALKRKIEAIQKEDPEKIKILLETRVLGLVSWNEFITGVRVKTPEGRSEEISGKAVVLTTGGFSADKGEDTSLLVEFAGAEKLKLPTTNGAFARGDGVKMARAMGAKVIGMDRVQVHPTAFVDPAAPAALTKFLAAEALRGKGAILLSSKGVRFVNELGRRDHVTGRIQKECPALPETFQGGSAGMPAALLVMNERSIDDFGRPAFNFYAIVKKFFKKYDNVDALATALGVDAAVIKKTLATYNEFVIKAADSKVRVKDSFEKTVFPVTFNEAEPLHVALITPAIHYTMGGLQINRKAEVFNEFMNKPFKGLVAAGEVAGGVHGANRLAGNSLLECVVYGRIAGKTAAEMAREGPPLPVVSTSQHSHSPSTTSSPSTPSQVVTLVA
ncbi:hypothetical protein PMAYCL1PPCAC_00225, partial [Pristionchus mayeri]